MNIKFRIYTLWWTDTARDNQKLLHTGAKLPHSFVQTHQHTAHWLERYPSAFVHLIPCRRGARAQKGERLNTEKLYGATGEIEEVHKGSEIWTLKQTVILTIQEFTLLWLVLALFYYQQRLSLRLPVIFLSRERKSNAADLSFSEFWNVTFRPQVWARRTAHATELRLIG